MVVDVDTEAGVGGSGGSQPAAEAPKAGAKPQFVPTFEKIPNGGPITFGDSTTDDPGIALGVLRAAALPEDVEKVPANWFATVGSLAQYVTMVS